MPMWRHKKYQQAIKECTKIAQYYNKKCKELGLDDERLSGYTAFSRDYGGIGLNGKGDNAHEEFTMREHFTENEPNFCKTARKPYDVVVTACLAVLKYRLGEFFNVSSDGRSDDWTNGVELARKVLRRKVPNPIKE